MSRFVCSVLRNLKAWKVSKQVALGDFRLKTHAANENRARQKDVALDSSDPVKCKHTKLVIKSSFDV